MDISEVLRNKVVDLKNKKILVSNLLASNQSNDLTMPPNCNGFGRIRHFRMHKSDRWLTDPLPNIPYATRMNIPVEETLQTQLFQISACNFRCWFCFVDDALLSANEAHSKFLSIEELFELYLAEPIQPKLIVLSGGHPYLAPEWLLWTIQKIQELKRDDLYVWTDDNLSNYYYWKYLSDNQRKYISNFYHQGRVGCFKGFDEESFMYNTKASASHFNQQFEVFDRIFKEGVDLYAYAIFTTAQSTNIKNKVSRFVDRLQTIHNNLPLRTIPLEIIPYTPVVKREKTNDSQALNVQYQVLECWNEELEKRFSFEERNLLISNVTMTPHER